MLPLSLIALLLQASAFLPRVAYAQTSRPSSSTTAGSSSPSRTSTSTSPPARLNVNSLNPFNTSDLPSPPVFSIPATSDSISITLASCLVGSSSSTRFFFSNDSSVTDPGPDSLGDTPGVSEITLDDTGIGEWTGTLQEGGFLSVLVGTTQQSFEVGISNTGPMHTDGGPIPLLGDSTSNQVLLFSPPFSPQLLVQPSYPNYTLPTANLSLPAGPSDPPNYQMFIAPTSSFSSAGIPQTGCAFQAAASGTGSGMLMLGSQQSEGLWLRDEDGWRWQWLVQGLSPSTNYTAFAVLGGTQVSEEIMFVTKSGGFSCPLVHSLPYCPRTAYAVPLPPPPAPLSAHDASSLPSTLTDPLISYMNNFTTSVLTHACGRDLYSPLVTCADCQVAYRKWLCAVSLPRCGEARPDDPTTQNQNTRRQQTTFSGALNLFGSSNNVQIPVSALVPQPTSSPPRNANLLAFSSNYSMLLPCLETCTAVDRACPVMLQFKCPSVKFTASMSYGVGFVDTGEEGVEGGGSTGALQDSFGNVWCNEG